MKNIPLILWSVTAIYFSYWSLRHEKEYEAFKKDYYDLARANRELTGVIASQLIYEKSIAESNELKK
jgi:hypothetical protein